MTEISHRELARASLPDAPYPGLRPFEPAEWGIFFGREVMAAEVIARLGRQNLIIVHGASGCGKSSLVRAGILPALQGDHELHRKEFRYAIIRPSQGPLDSLAAALLDQLGPPDPDSPDQSWLERLAIEQDMVGLVEQKLAAANATFCLIVDQFEEIFRWAEGNDRSEAEFLVEFMIAVAKGGPRRNLFVLTTMRSDYLGQCAGFRDFAAVVNDCQYLLDNLDEFAVLRAIHEPAERFGGTVTPVLADRLRFGARDDPDALPVLQHTLMRMYDALADKSKGWMLDLADLERVSGEDGPLSQHAEDIYREVTEGAPSRAEALEWIFRALTELDAGGRAIRRPRSLDELAAVSGTDHETVLALVEAFSRPGRNFLVVAEPDGGELEVDVGHEAFIRRWRRIGDNSVDPETGQRTGWLHREFQAGLTWKAMAVFAKRGETSLEPDMTKAWLPFFEQVEKRPAWAARYFVDPIPAVAPEKQPEWLAVTKLMAVSKERMTREGNRWRRLLLRSWGYLLVIVLLFAAAATALSVKLGKDLNGAIATARSAQVASAAALREQRKAQLDIQVANRRTAAALRNEIDAGRRAEIVARDNIQRADERVHAADGQVAEARALAARIRQDVQRERSNAELAVKIVMKSLRPISRTEADRAKRFQAMPTAKLPDDFRAGLRSVLAAIGRGPSRTQEIADRLEDRRAKYGLTTDKRLAAFLTIALLDTNRFTSLAEELDLPEAEVQSRFSDLLGDERPAAAFANRPEELANEAYAGLGGNDAAGDGWTYRGRGLILLRGKDQYLEMQNRLRIPLVSEPDLLLDPKYAVLVALDRWQARGGNKAADSGQIFSRWRWISGTRNQRIDLWFSDNQMGVQQAIARALGITSPYSW